MCLAGRLIKPVCRRNCIAIGIGGLLSFGEEGWEEKRREEVAGLKDIKKLQQKLEFFCLVRCYLGEIIFRP
jgi:hypothetical protein